MTDDCFVCRKHRGEVPIPGGVLYEDDLVSATFPDGATYPAHVMLDTRSHVAELADLTVAEAEAVGRGVSRLALALRGVCRVEHVYSFVIGDGGVPHLHVHVIGRFPGTPREFWGHAVTRWPDAPRATGGERETLAARLRAFLAS